MARDQLRQPLRRRRLGERLWARRPSAFAACAIGLPALLLAGGVWLASIPYPFAGEPVVMAAIPPVRELHTASTAGPEKPPTEASPEDVIDDNARLGDPPPDEEALPADSEPSTRPVEAQVIVAGHRPLRKAPLDAVTETTPEGPLPRISAKGQKPFDAYSQVTPMQVTTSRRPRIALVIGGMGLNARLTEKAIKDLPGDVSFGFAPYGENLQKQVNRARANGHEVLLQVPMEPVGYPGNNPGPNTLLSDADAADNLGSLRWHMSRFAGYSGVTNYMGARLLVSEKALAPVMREVKDRGLVYLEDATVNLTLSPKIVQQVKLPMRRASLVIDTEPTAPAIADALEKLEQEALANGIAIGTGSGLEVTIDTIAEWSRSLAEKGILLVPVSVAYKGRAG